MQTYELLVTGRSVKANSQDTTLVRTSVGIDQIHVMFDSDEWLAFPVKVTFGNGRDTVTQSLAVNALDGGEWVSEATCTVPWEAVREVGPIRVTFQGTDSEGNHIITAAGAPLSVVEAGDVAEGSVPEPAPTQTEWEQAYADAMVAVNQAASLVANLQAQLGQMVADAQAAISSQVERTATPATTEELGCVIPDGETILVDEDGVISAAAQNGITNDQVAALTNLRRLAALCFDSTFDDDGLFVSGTLLPTSLSKATTEALGGVKPDGSTILVDEDGVISGARTYTLPPATTETLGGVIPDGTTIAVDEDGRISGATTYELPVADAATLGGVKAGGEAVSIGEDGTVTVLVNDPFNILSKSASGLFVRTEKLATHMAGSGLVPEQGSNFEWKFAVRTDGQSIDVNDQGQLYATGTVSAADLPTATSDQLGVVKPDGTTVTIDEYGVLSAAGGSGGPELYASSPLSISDGMLSLNLGTGGYLSDNSGLDLDVYSLVQAIAGSGLSGNDGRLGVSVAEGGGLLASESGLAVDASSLLSGSGSGLQYGGGGLAVSVDGTTVKVSDDGGCLYADFSALPIDGSTIRRDDSSGSLYVDDSAVKCDNSTIVKDWQGNLTVDRDAVVPVDGVTVKKHDDGTLYVDVDAIRDALGS